MRQFKFVLLTALSVSLAGCSQMFSPSYEPLLLDYDDVSYIQERLLSLPPRDMLIEGITISNARCDQFFESLERRQSDADFSLAQLAALSTGLPPILARASVSSQAVANVAAALGFATGFISDSKELYLLAEFKPAIFVKWQVARQTAKEQILNLVAEEPNLSLSLAKDQLYEYTRLCMRHQLKAWLHDAANQGRPIEVPSEGVPLASAGPVVGAPGGGDYAERRAMRKRLPQIQPMIVR